MPIQVKHLRPAVSALRLSGLGVAVTCAWSTTCFPAAAEEETVTRVSYSAAGMRTGQPVFGLAVRHTKSGALVSQIFENGPASKAGLQPGDVLVSGDGTALGEKSQSELLSFLAARPAARFQVRGVSGALRLVELKKVAPEMFASADGMITVRGREMATVEIGKPPPDFSASANGESVRLSECSGKPVVVIFGATWCLPCMAEVPALKALYAKFHPRSVEFIGVSLDDDRAKMDRYLKTQGIPWPQNFDGKGTDNAVAQEWGVARLPVLVLIGRDGRVLEKKVPIGSLGASLEKALR